MFLIEENVSEIIVKEAKYCFRYILKLIFKFCPEFQDIIRFLVEVVLTYAYNGCVGKHSKTKQDSQRYPTASAIPVNIICNSAGVFNTNTFSELLKL